jgi:hypothetical protein
MIGSAIDFILIIFVKCLLAVAIIAWSVLALMLGTVIVYHLVNFVTTLIQGVV